MRAHIHALTPLIEQCAVPNCSSTIFHFPHPIFLRLLLLLLFWIVLLLELLLLWRCFIFFYHSQCIVPKADANNMVFLSFSCNIWMFSYWCCLHCCVLPLISFLYVEEIFFGSEWNGFSFSSAMNIVLWPISFRMRSTKHQPSYLSLCDWSYSRLFFIHYMAKNEKKNFFAAVYLFFPSLTQIQVFNQKENICLAYKE